MQDVYEINPNTKVLIVSSDLTTATNISLQLKTCGLKDAQIQQSGIAALDMAERSGFQLILCDIQTTHMDGWMFLQEVKNSDRIQNCPIILFGKTNPGITPEKLKQYGSPAFQELPLSNKQLMESITFGLQECTTKGSLENKFTEAKESLIKKDADKAQQQYETLFEITNKSVRSAVGLSQSYELQQNHEKIREISQHLPTDADQSPTVLMIVLRQHFKNDNLDEAMKISEAILTKTNNTPIYFIAIVDLANKHKFIEMAEKIAKSAIVKGFSSPDFHFAIAKAKFTRGDIEGAIKSLRKHPDAIQTSLPALNLLGVALLRVGKHAESRQTLLNALKIAPLDPKVLFNLALVDIDSGNPSSAIRHLETCLKVHPNYKKAEQKLAELKKDNAA